MDSPELRADITVSWLLTTDREAENAKDTLCRNVTIYGRCRYEDKGISIFGRSVVRELAILIGL